MHSPNRFQFTLLLLLVGTFSLQLARAQSQEKVYTMLMLTFARGIEWPSFKTAGTFVIGVFEYPPLVAELNSTAGNLKISGRKIEIKELTTTADLEGCNMVFIPAYKARQFGSVLDRLGADATLIVTNKMDMAKKGAGVNFVLVDGKLKYEINCKSIEKRGMKISASVKGMGIVVN
jgi:hypothetical protein